MAMMEIIANDRLGRKVRVKCSPDDSIEDLKALIGAQTGTDPSKIILKKWYTEYRHIDGLTVGDVFTDGMSLEMY